jgi:hypothetical protein
MATGATTMKRASKNGTPGVEVATVPANGYVVPLVHVRVPELAVELAFWGVLAGAAVTGTVDPPVAVLLGAGVLVARHLIRDR